VGHWGGVAARGMGRGLAWPRRHVGRAGDASVRAGGRGGVGGVAGGLAPRMAGGRGKPRRRAANPSGAQVGGRERASEKKPPARRKL